MTPLEDKGGSESNSQSSLESQGEEERKREISVQPTYSEKNLEKLDHYITSRNVLQTF